MEKGREHEIKKAELVEVFIEAKGSNVIVVCRCNGGSYNLSTNGSLFTTLVFLMRVPE